MNNGILIVISLTATITHTMDYYGGNPDDFAGGNYAPYSAFSPVWPAVMHMNAQAWQEGRTQGMLETTYIHHAYMAQKQQRSQKRRQLISNVATHLNQKWRNSETKDSICDALSAIKLHVEQETNSDEMEEWCTNIYYFRKQISSFIKFVNKCETDDEERKQRLQEQFNWLTKFLNEHADND
jgi:glycyl-tRNA synthetase beta subunit